VKRGEVRWYTFKAPDKRRPVLILARDSAIGVLNAVTVAPISSTGRDIPTEVYLTVADGMQTECAVNLDNIQTVPKANLGPLIATLSMQRMEEVNQAICFALGFDSLLF
jgi:mRNA interferase MazF